MTPELKQKWIDALESGNYQQCRGRLHDGKGYCCLGVLCVVAGAPFCKDDDFFDDFYAFYYPHPLHGVHIHDTDSLLNAEGLAAFGLTREQQDDLTCHNDGRPAGLDSYGNHYPAVQQKSFAEIAQIIRETL